MGVNLQPQLTPKAQCDLELVSRALKNDENAYAQLMGKYEKSVYHRMLRMVYNESDARDLTLEAFGKAFRKLDSYTPTFAFSTWLFKIAHNNGIDFLRKKKMKFMSIDQKIDGSTGQDFSNNILSDTKNPEEIIIHGQKVKLLRNVLKQLNHKYRLMIELRFFEDLSYEEISNVLEIPLGTVKAQLFRAKEILFTILEKPENKAQLEMKKSGKTKRKRA